MRVFFAFLLGLVASYLAIVAGAFLYMDAAGIFDRDGGMAMGVIFGLGPLGALIGSTAAAILTYVYTRRHPRKPKDNETPASRQKRIVLAAVISGLVAYIAATFVVWLQSGPSYESYWAALLIVWSPYLLGLAAAAFAGWISARRT